MIPDDQESAVRPQEWRQRPFGLSPHGVAPRVSEAPPAKGTRAGPPRLPALDKALEKFLHLQIGEQGHQIVRRLLDDHARTPVTKRSARLT